MPGKLIHTEKVKHVLGRKGQSKTNRTQVIPSSCACVRSRLLGATVEVTCQKSKEGERRFFFRKPIQRHRQRRNCPEEARRKRAHNPHHLPTKEIKEGGGGPTEDHIWQTEPTLGAHRTPAIASGHVGPVLAKRQT